jgi:hypothetical protein
MNSTLAVLHPETEKSRMNSIYNLLNQLSSQQLSSRSQRSKFKASWKRKQTQAQQQPSLKQTQKKFKREK